MAIASSYAVSSVQTPRCPGINSQAFSHTIRNTVLAWHNHHHIKTTCLHLIIIYILGLPAGWWCLIILLKNDLTQSGADFGANKTYYKRTSFGSGSRKFKLTSWRVYIIYYTNITLLKNQLPWVVKYLRKRLIPCNTNFENYNYFLDML